MAYDDEDDYEEPDVAEDVEEAPDIPEEPEQPEQAEPASDPSARRWIPYEDPDEPPPAPDQQAEQPQPYPQYAQAHAAGVTSDAGPELPEPPAPKKWTPYLDPDNPEDQAELNKKWMPYTEPDTPLGTIGRKIAHNVLPTAAGIGAAAATMPLGPWVAIPAGIAAFWGTSELQERGLEAAGVSDAEIQRANRLANPKADIAGDVISAAIPFGIGPKLALGQRAVGAGVGTVMEGVGQVREGHFDPVRLAAGAATGAAFNDPRRVTRAFEQQVARGAGRVTGRPDWYAPPAPPPPTQPGVRNQDWTGPPADIQQAPAPTQGQMPFGSAQRPIETPPVMTPRDWQRHADIAERWETATPRERAEYAALTQKAEAAEVAAKRPQIGGGEAQPELPGLRAEPPEPGRPPIKTQPELALEPPPVVNAEGQYGFSINAPDTASRHAATTASPDSMPGAAGTSREMPPPRTAEWPAVPEGARAKEPNPNQRGPQGPHSIIGEGMAQEAHGVTPDAARGIHVLQPGQQDPTVRAGLAARTEGPAAPPKPRTTFEPPRTPDGTYPPPDQGPIPRERSLAPLPPRDTQGVTERPVPAGHTRMYQGERQPPNVFTTDRKIAERYGRAKYVDVHDKQGMPFFTPGRDVGTFTTRNNIYRTRSRPVREMMTETTGPKPPPEGPTPPPAGPTPPPAGPAPPPVGPAPPPAGAAGPREMLWKVKGQNRTVRVSPVIAKPGYTRITYKGKDYVVPNSQLHEKPTKGAAAAPAVTVIPPKPAAGPGGPKLLEVARDQFGRTAKISTISDTTLREALNKAGTRPGLLDDVTTFIRDAVLKQVGNMRVYVVSKAEMERLGQGGAAGFYNKQQDHIILNAAEMHNPTSAAHTVLHEALHAVTAHAARQDRNLKKVINALMRDILTSEAKYLQKTTGATKMRPETSYGFFGDAKKYDLKNLDEAEFIAETFSNPRFQELLRQHKIGDDVAKALQEYLGKHAPVQSAWDGIVQSVRKLLGLGPNELNALEAAMRVTERAMAVNPKRKTSYMAKAGVKQEDFAEALPARGKGPPEPDIGPVTDRERAKGTQAYHATTEPIERFRDLGEPREQYMPDRMLGYHFAKDPAVANSFAMERFNDKEHGAKPGGRLIPVRLPHESEMLTLSQPHYDHAKGKPPGAGTVETDQVAVAKAIAAEAYPKRPDILANFLENARNVPKADADRMAKDLVAGKTVDLPHDGPHDLKRVINNFTGAMPFDANLKRELVRSARESWQEQGYKGVKYINTSPMETMASAGVKDPTSYIVFDPKTVVGRFTNALPARGKSSSEPDIGPMAGKEETPLFQRLIGTGVSHPGKRWQIIDRHTGKVMGEYANRRRASTRVDRLDNEYGAYRYYAKSVDVKEPTTQPAEPKGTIETLPARGKGQAEPDIGSLVEPMAAPKGKASVMARDKFGNEIGFTGETVHAAAARAKAAGYREVFNKDGSPYVAPKAAAPAAAPAAPAAVPPGGGGPPAGGSPPAGGTPRGPSGTPASSVEAARQSILDQVAEKPAWYSKLPTSKEEAKAAWRRFYTATKNAMDPFDQARKRDSRDLTPEEDFAMLARLTKGMGGRFQAMIKHGTYDITTGKINGKGLDEVIKPIADNPKEFTAYALAKRAIELHGRGIKTGMNVANARMVVAADTAKFEPVFRDLVEFQGRVLDNMVKTGILSHASAAKMRQLNKEYVPFYRMLDPNSELGQQLGAGLQTKQPIHRIKGSDKDVFDPIDSIVKNTYLFTDLAHRNQALVAMKKFNESLPPEKQFMTRDRSSHPIEVKETELQGWMDKHGIEGFADDALTIFRPNAFRPADDKIRLYVNGKQEIYKVSPDVGKAVNAMDQQSQELWLKIVSTPAKMLRAGAVLSPEFMLRNPFRDMLTAFIQAKHGSIPIYDQYIGLKEIFGKTKDYQEWLIGGGANANLVSLDRAILHTNPLNVKGVSNVIKNPSQWLEPLRKLSELSENATRVGMYKRARGKGVHQLEAAFSAREGTLDFARVGSHGAMRAANSMIPFLNVHIEGMDQAARAFKRDPTGFLTKVSVGITMPSVLLWLRNKDDERVQQLPAWQRDLFWIVTTDDWKPISTEGRNKILDSMEGRLKGVDISKLKNTFRQTADGKWEYNNGTIYRIPKPFELGVIFGSIPERILDAYFTEKPNAFKNLDKTVMRAMIPNVVPQAVLPVAEQWANRSLFLDRTLLTEAQQKLPPAQQFGPHTSETAKVMGEVIRSVAGDKSSFGSPVIIDNYLRQWTGGLGKHATDIIDGLIKSTDKNAPPEPTKSPSEWVGYKAFVARFPDRGAQAIQDFYDARNERKMEQAGIKEQRKTDPQGAAERMRKSSPYTGDPTATILKASRDAVTRITRDKDMSPDDKRAAIDLTYLLMIEHAKRGIESMERTKRK